jgi:hypothetical protein
MVGMHHFAQLCDVKEKTPLCSQAISMTPALWDKEQEDEP